LRAGIPAAITAIFYFLPNGCPFLAPGKGAVADNANFLRKMLFLMRHTSKNKQQEK